MEVKDEDECRRELDEHRKIQKELREVERLSFASKEMQENLMESMQHQLQEEEKRRNDLMPEYQKVQKRSQKIQSIPDKKKLQKESLAAREETLKPREEIEWKEERFTQLADKVDKNRMADAEMETELHVLQAGEERRGGNASQAVACCLETVEHIFAVGTDQAKSQFDALYQKILKRFETPTPPAQMPGREEGRRDSKNEQEQGRASQQLLSFMPSMPGGVNQVAPASSLELFLVYGVYLVNAEVQEDCKRPIKISRTALPG